MGWTVLYIAFGVVALWLLGEVLLQYKARLRWRLLAFGGFLGVVIGVLIPSVIVIGVGAAAFAVGQTYVTLSFRRGFAEGWAVSRPTADGTTGRRRGKGGHQDPSLEVTALEAADGGPDGYGQDAGTPFGGDAVAYGQDKSAYGDEDHDRDDVFTPARPAEPTAAGTASVYEPQPLPDDTGSYGVYSDTAYASATQPQDQYATAAQGADQGYGYDGYGQQQYGYDGSGEQQYAAYSDPYIGTQTYGGAPTTPGTTSSSTPSRATTRSSTAPVATTEPRPAVSGSRSSATPTTRSAANSRPSSRTPTRATGNSSRGTATTSSTASDGRSRPPLPPREAARAVGGAHCEPRNSGPSTTSPDTSAPDIPAWGSPPPGCAQPPTVNRPGRAVELPGCSSRPPAAASAGAGTEPPSTPVSSAMSAGVRTSRHRTRSRRPGRARSATVSAASTRSAPGSAPAGTTTLRVTASWAESGTRPGSSGRSTVTVGPAAGAGAVPNRASNSPSRSRVCTIVRCAVPSGRPPRSASSTVSRLGRPRCGTTSP